MKFLNAIIESIEDANPKIVLFGLGILQYIIENQWSLFAVAVNSTFDALVNKLNDIKVIYHCHCHCHCL